jgi:glycosyltransferase involved in cell wall biosynthesis
MTSNFSKPFHKAQKKDLHKISIIIASKNSYDTIELCLQSILKQSYFSDGKIEIVVVDANSKDNTKSILKRYANRVKVVCDRGEGLPKARNEGLRIATGDIVFHIDADFVFQQDAIRNCIKYIDKGYDAIINRFGIVYDMGFWRMIRSWENIISLYYWGQAGNVPGASRYGGPRIYTKQILERISGHNERIRFYGEDEELRWRLIEANARIIFANDVLFNKIEENDPIAIFQKVFRYGFEMIDFLKYNKKWVSIRISGVYLNALIPLLPFVTSMIGFLHSKSIKISIALFICKWLRMIGQSLGILYRCFYSFHNLKNFLFRKQ